jgi:uncharacterized protein
MLFSLRNMQSFFIYHPPKPARKPDTVGAIFFQEVSKNKQPVIGLHWPAQLGRRTVVMFHGNAEQIADVVPLAEMFEQRGLGVVAVEYPGYGLAAEGTSNEANLYEVAEHAIQYIQKKHSIPKEALVLLGQSLGTGVASEMALRGHARCLLLVSPFTSMRDVAQQFAPKLLIRFIFSKQYETYEKAIRISIPTMIIHGTQDQLIPPHMGQYLAERFPQARLRWVQNAGHNNVYGQGGNDLFQEMVDFIDHCSASELPTLK